MANDTACNFQGMQMTSLRILRSFTRAKAALFSHIISRERNHLGTFFNVKGMFLDVEALVNHSALTLNACNHLLNKI